MSQGLSTTAIVLGALGMTVSTLLLALIGGKAVYIGIMIAGSIVFGSGVIADAIAGRRG